MAEGLSKNLQDLDAFLCSESVDDDAMLLSEMEGFLAAVIVCPDLIRPGEWLPVVWGEKGPDFADPHQAQRIIDLIVARYNEIIRELDRGQYRPLFEIFMDDEIVWEPWIEGFWQGMGLRPEAWSAFAEAQSEDKEVQRALFILARLATIAGLWDDDDEVLDFDDDLEDAAADLIPSHVEILHRARRAAAGETPGPAVARGRKIGRNAPCPCGSGKKYKQCCLR